MEEKQKDMGLILMVNTTAPGLGLALVWVGKSLRWSAASS